MPRICEDMPAARANRPAPPPAPRDRVQLKPARTGVAGDRGRDLLGSSGKWVDANSRGIASPR